MLKEYVRKKVHASNKLLCLLSLEFNAHYKTVSLWATKNDIRLTTPKALEIIAKELQIPESELIQK